MRRKRGAPVIRSAGKRCQQEYGSDTSARDGGWFARGANRCMLLAEARGSASRKCRCSGGCRENGQRNAIERTFAKLKQFRRFATRYDKRARLGFMGLCAARDRAFVNGLPAAAAMPDLVCQVWNTRRVSPLYS